MNTQTCNSCGGVYVPLQGDGSLYFHVCPDSVPANQRRNENVKSVFDRSPIAVGQGVTPGGVIPEQVLSVIAEASPVKGG